MSKYQTVEDIPDHFVLVSHDLEVPHILESIGMRQEDIEDYPVLFVELLDGDYGEIYGITSIVPWLNKPVYNLRAIVESYTEENNDD